EVGQPESNEALIFVVSGPSHEPEFLGPADEADGAVMTNQQVVGNVGDRRAARIAVTSDGDEKLMLRGGQSDRRRLGLAPMAELPQRHPELEELRELLVRQLARHR